MIYAIAKGYTAVGGKGNEWLFVDPKGRDRFGCRGVLGGAGEGGGGSILRI